MFSFLGKLKKKTSAEESKETEISLSKVRETLGEDVLSDWKRIQNGTEITFYSYKDDLYLEEILDGRPSDGYIEISISGKEVLLAWADGGTRVSILSFADRLELFKKMFEMLIRELENEQENSGEGGNELDSQ